MSKNPQKEEDLLNVEERGARFLGRILIVDDEPSIREAASIVLTGIGYLVETAQDGDAAEALLARMLPELILLDIKLPGRSGLDLLTHWSLQYPKIPVILMSGEATVSEALKGLQQGAYDFLEKPLARARLVNAVSRTIEVIRLKEKEREEGVDEIIGQSEVLKKLLLQIQKVSLTKARVLITGESGTGKELIARSIHRLSARKERRFVRINCAAIPNELIETELFGHVKGAFTGAHTARKGLFEVASGGTLFLDEVAELPLTAQAKLLRVLQNGEFSPVGSNETFFTDVRILAATNRNLKSEVEEGRFREDLFYRLAVVSIESPPLRSRSDDIPMLVNHFKKQIEMEHGLEPKNCGDNIMRRMQQYNWPGNIRELKNVVERLLILSEKEVCEADLPVELLHFQSVNLSEESVGSTSILNLNNELILPWGEFKLRSEREYLTRILKTTSNNVSEAAEILGVERTTVYKWIKALRI